MTKKPINPKPNTNPPPKPVPEKKDTTPTEFIIVQETDQGKKKSEPL